MQSFLWYMCVCVRVCVHAVNIYHQLSYAREGQPDGENKVEKGKGGEEGEREATSL